MDKTLAALSFFTRIPFWRLRDIPAGAYTRVVDLWSLAGWLTGATACGTYLLASAVFAPPVAAVLALAARTALTGALHEDGLADFFDGFGGGRGDRERILAIMKDSRTGSYGVMALILYFMLAAAALASMPGAAGAVAILVSDVWSKSVAAWTINLLPYARTAATAKNRLVYNRMSPPAATLCMALGAAALILLPLRALPAAMAPVAVTGGAILYMRRKIGGYTGDCCGAVYLMSELSMLLALAPLIST